MRLLSALATLAWAAYDLWGARGREEEDPEEEKPLGEVIPFPKGNSPAEEDEVEP